MRNNFDKQLTQLNKELTEMGAMCEEIIELVSKALTENSGDTAEAASVLENEIDNKERTIETLCMRLLLQQQPVASDLRKISSALKMITDMERIGDQAKDIAEYIPYIAGKKFDNSEYITFMAKSCVKIVTESIDAYVKQDVELAKKAISYDDVIDAYFCKIQKKIIELIAVMPDEGVYLSDLLMVAKYFERIGDHAVNIAEWVVFSVTGIHKKW